MGQGVAADQRRQHADARGSRSTTTAATPRSRSQQTATVEHPTLRRHRIGIGLYDLEANATGSTAWSVVRTWRWTSTASRPTIAELVGVRQPDLLLLNDGDLTYAKIRLDERSLETVIGGLSRLDDSLARALCWGAAWDMTRDAEMSATDFVTLVLGNIAAETDAFGSARIPAYAAQAVNNFSAPANRAALRRDLGAGPAPAARRGRAGQRPPAHLRARLRRGRAQRRGARTTSRACSTAPWCIDGLAVDTDLRWALLTGLARAGRADEDADRRRSCAADNTISGQERAAAARAARPTAEAKAEAWEIAVVRDDVPNETQRSVVLSFMQPGQEEVLAALRREVPRGRRDPVGGEGHPARLDRAGVPLPAAAGLAGAARAGDTWLQDSPAQPGRQALRARGRSRRRALPRRPGEGRRGELAVHDGVNGALRRASSQRRFPRVVKPQPLLVQGRGLPGGLGQLADAVLDAADEVAGGEGGLHAGDGEADGVVAQRAAYDGAGDHLERRAAGSTRISTLRAGEDSAACSRCAKACDVAVDRRRRRPRTRSGRRSRPRGSPGRSRPPGPRRRLTSWPLVPPVSLELASICSGVTSSAAFTPLRGAAEPLGLAAPGLARLVAAVAGQRRQHRQQRDHRRQRRAG